jgi:hypothetical protein
LFIANVATGKAPAIAAKAMAAAAGAYLLLIIVNNSYLDLQTSSFWIHANPAVEQLISPESDRLHKKQPSVDSLHSVLSKNSSILSDTTLSFVLAL